ncbi:MAG: putative dehydrogenase [Glaciihabitans sp.]|nr:putative dehydrogenase [Glaciihabitans sp.]
MLRIGILGASGIAPASIIRPARRREDAVVAAVASRSTSAADDYAATHGIERSYGSYDALLADPTVQLVYVALPPSQHARWSIAALEAGKDVLCEKPFAMNRSEAEEMTAVAVANGRRIIEAFHDRYHPLSSEMDRILASERLGRLISVHADFSASIPISPSSIRHDPTVGGGSLMDLGCYSVHQIRALIGEEPAVISAAATLNPFGADLSMDADLAFPSGVLAKVTCTMVEDTPFNSSVELIGTAGTARFNNLVFPSRGHNIQIVVDGLTSAFTVAGRETYDHQLEAVVRGLESGDPLLTEGTDPVHNMAIIDAIYESAGFDR